ncbi:glycosyltransferase family 4 protein [candidate division KSB1 bacterium]|nr:glycosyltransferase family 4 protein [candidate division KSB1 bacterium]
MIKIAFICPQYSDEKQSHYSFIHARVKKMVQMGYDIKVFVISNENVEYCFEKVNVVKKQQNAIRSMLSKFSPDVLAIHYPTYQIISFVKNIDLPKVAWIHGHEILWNFRLNPAKNIIDYVRKRLVFFPREIYKVLTVRKFIPTVEYSVFVSQWMLEEAERHTFRRYTNSVIIPNPVDTDLFSYYEPQSMQTAISLRGLNNTKYGLDVGIRAFSYVDEAQLAIVGTGLFQKKLQRLIDTTHSNTKILARSVEHNKIPELYRNYSFFFAPSRVEAQGLAMCEAMSSGLPVVATNVGGIPEFVRDGIDGYLVPPNNPLKLSEAVKKLVSNKETFLKMSRNARENIMNVCSAQTTIPQEIEILKKAIEKHATK